jgi:diguanylate cyclase (GGDEF)-like protein
MNAHEFRPEGTRTEIPGRLAGACMTATTALLVGEYAVAPAGERPLILAITASCGLTFVVAALLASRQHEALALHLAGGVLMVLGMAAGALLPGGIDGAAILPLAGALLIVPARRGRTLGAVFVLAFMAAMIGEAAVYAYGSLGNVVSADRVPRSLAGSAVMIALVYGLAWWVGNRWWTATTHAQRVLASQRRLLEVNEQLLSTLDPEAVLSLLADKLKSLVAYDNLTIYRVDRQAGMLRPVVARDRFAQLILDTTFPIDVGVTGWVARHGEAQCVNDMQDDPRATTVPGTPDEPEALIVVPLRDRGEVTGTLNVGRMGGEEAYFSPGEFDLVRLFAGQASIALQNAEIHRAIWDRAENDALTGLRNRGAFDQRLDALLAAPSAKPIALVMVDLDDFKAYNDERGHPAGDAVLRAVGKAIGSTVRDRDLAFRYGGDEFAILLPHTGADDAARMADRVLRTIASLALPGARTMTASAGVACHLGHEDGRALVSAADAELYRAKASGGNRVAGGLARRTRAARRPRA